MFKEIIERFKLLTKLGIVTLLIKIKNFKMKMKSNSYRYVRPGLAAIGLSVLIFGFAIMPTVNATSYQAQINNLNSLNAQNQANINALKAQAGNYQQAISNYQTQINAVESSIAVNQSKQTQRLEHLIRLPLTQGEHSDKS